MVYILPQGTFNDLLANMPRPERGPSYAGFLAQKWTNDDTIKAQKELQEGELAFRETQLEKELASLEKRHKQSLGFERPKPTLSEKLGNLAYLVTQAAGGYQTAGADILKRAQQEAAKPQPSLMDTALNAMQYANAFTQQANTMGADVALGFQGNLLDGTLSGLWNPRVPS